MNLIIGMTGTALKFRALSSRKARKIAEILVLRGYTESLAEFSYSLAPLRTQAGMAEPIRKPTFAGPKPSIAACRKKRLASMFSTTG